MTNPVVIVGVGALGSHVALFIRNLPLEIRLVDPDRVETKNTQSQFHTKMGVSRNKTQALQQAFQAMWGLKIEANTNRLTADNVQVLLGGAALVLDCVDNPEARHVIQRFVRAQGIPCLHGAMDGAGTLGRVVWDEMFRIDEGGDSGQATCEDGRNLPFHALVSAQMALVAQRFLEMGEKRSYHILPSGIVRIG
jgi:molybdopterin/thiamine biosynthesis adenylyltransferase